MEIYELINREAEYKRLTDALDQEAKKPSSKERFPLTVTGMCEGVRSALTLMLSLRSKHPTLLLAQDEKTANRICDLAMNLGLDAIFYPRRDFMFYQMTASHEFEYERLSVLCSIQSGYSGLIVTTADAALQYTCPPEKLKNSFRTLKPGDVYEITELALFLASSGYARTEQIDAPGQFSLRGGILDVYPVSEQYPVRIEFFGDELDSISSFDIMTQRRFEELDSVTLTPALEVLIDPTTRDLLTDHIIGRLAKSKDPQQTQTLRSEIEELQSGRFLRSADKYISFIYPERNCLLDYFPKESQYIIYEQNAQSERIESYEWRMDEDIKGLLAQGLDGDIADFGLRGDFIEDYISEHAGVICDTFLTGSKGRRTAGLFNFTSKQTPSYADKPDLLFEDVVTYLRGGFRAVILAENDMAAKQIVSYLDEKGIDAITRGEPVFGHPLVISGVNFPGFELPASNTVILSAYLSGAGMSGSVRKVKRKHRKVAKGERIASFTDLAIGDLVVHENHGIGQYLGIQSLTLEGARRDFVKIKYAGKDMLYLPCDQLDSITKYIGADAQDGIVKLSKMGGSEWVKAKAKAKHAATDMAKDLIKLYAERMKRPGIAFEKDDEMQRAFESEFEYDETDSQLRASQDIKSDMERPVPMDRLLCGDVGFGKTEVALRAAFKAVCSSKQVAVLVPTTILAMQHFRTFTARMRGFPVKVDMLSRFRTPKQQKQTTEGIKRGDVDIVIGTHRMVSKDVEFRRLGLVIVDEEQRFGVAQKEKLKQLATDADVLTLTATPIPRTLNMALSGIRDMSVLEEAPGERLPVQTYVLEYDDNIIKNAINSELRRGGQVFYLYNKVETINKIADKVAKFAPDARIAVAHGQMDKEDLSDIWKNVITGDIDILISTTIIETGVDIPNANTLIIENADHMGLSQLHQIRGRIGRSARRAYAYFTYPKGRVLNEISEKRLSAIRDYTEFGSGFRIAMRDLEIRGAGNLLGGEQHGHIESVGYDLYMKILEQAIKEEKGDPAPPPKPECNIDVRFNAFLPESYVSGSVQRIDAYRRIAAIETDADLDDVADELRDRYGEPPKSVNTLLSISLMRSLGSSAGITKITHNGHSLLFYPEKLEYEIWCALAAKKHGKLLINVSSRPYVTLRMNDPNLLPTEACVLLTEYIQMLEENKLKNKEQ